MDVPERNTALLSWHLFIDCPHCEAEIDLADGEYDEEGRISKPIFNNRWDDLKGEEIECPKCKKVFTIDDVEY